MSRVLAAVAGLFLAAAAQASEDEWTTPDFTEAPAQPELELSAFDDSPVPVDGRARFELQAGLWLTEQASHLRSSNPTLGLGFTSRMGERIRIDAGYRFTFTRVGTSAVNVFNTFHGLRVRGHYAMPVGGTWFTLGAGPAGYLVTAATTANGAATTSTLSIDPGAELAAGFETQVSERLVRFEFAGALRGLRLDLIASVAVGF